MAVFPVRNSANACNNARINPFLSEGITTVDGFTVCVAVFFFFCFRRNGDGLTLNKNPDPLAEKLSMSLYLDLFLKE